MRTLFLFLFTGCFLNVLSQDKFWTRKEGPVSPVILGKHILPAKYQLYQLDEQALSDFSVTIPSESKTKVTFSASVLIVPGIMGLESFRVVEASVMEPVLQARHPRTRSYAGQGISNVHATIRFDISARGFHGSIMEAGKPTVYIDPVGQDERQYMVYSRKDAGASDFICETSEAFVAINENPAGRLAADDGKLRIFRLALACTGEYSQYFLNGTETNDAQRIAKVNAAMVTLLTRTNQIYERDFGIRMVLVANNDAIIYLNPATDPWTNEWNTKTQQTIDAVIGNANYDIGHLVHKGSNNGNAGCIGCVCTTGSKGSGYTSHSVPEGDPFVVDYTTHEMGHQFGGNHTFTHSNEGTTVQVEPGSGSTIMGYAGITGSTDVQAHSDDYFHSKTIEQVSNNYKTGSSTCAVVNTTGNLAPTVNAGLDYIIPKSTPFRLAGTASDATVGNLQYCWEQINQRATGFSTIPSSTATAGPQFRSYNYTSLTERTIPQLTYILGGTNNYTWEVLPSVSRTFNFRFTARDNYPGGGNNNTDDMVLTVNGTSGPFAVTAPNTGIVWQGGSTQTVTWSVNSSDIAPVSCANVKISLSTDGGISFPTVLLASTPNDGSQVITVPSVITSQARVKVEAVGNIFFDIGNVNFNITAAPTCTDPYGLTSTAVTASSANLNWSAVAGANNYNAEYKLTASSTWSPAATATTSTTISLTGLQPATAYDWRVQANCTGVSSGFITSQFTTLSNGVCNPATGLYTSAVTYNSATANWTSVPGATGYDVEIKKVNDAAWTVLSTGQPGTSRNISSLSTGTDYEWRVRANCTSNSGSYSSIQFRTGEVITICNCAGQ